MRSLKVAGMICHNGLRKWSSDYRIWCIAVLLLILAHMFSKDVADFSNALQIKMTPWIFAFYFSQKYIKLLFLFPLVLLFCDAPFIDATQPFILIRSGKTAWTVGQIFYIAVSSAFYFLFLFLLSLLVNLPHIQYSMDWGKIFGTLAKTSATASGPMELGLTFSSKIVDYFTPLQAVGFSLLLCWLSGVFLGVLIYFVNAITKNTILGPLVASGFLILDASVSGHYSLYFFSPISWCTLDNISR